MKLYQSMGPNPRIVMMMIAEKGISVPRAVVDIMAGENRQPEYLKVNPFGQIPALALDDGAVIPEWTAICEYLEELFPAAPMIGATPAERALTRALVHRIDQDVLMPMTFGFRGAEGLPIFQNRVRCLPEAADGMKACAADGLRLMEQILGDNDYLAGSRFSLADIVLFSFVEFGGFVGQAIPEDLTKLKAWQARVSARPSAAVSANPNDGV
jgi:glutathione S-transferase